MQDGNLHKKIGEKKYFIVQITEGPGADGKKGRLTKSPILPVYIMWLNVKENHLYT